MPPLELWKMDMSAGGSIYEVLEDVEGKAKRMMKKAKRQVVVLRKKVVLQSTTIYLC